MTQGEPFQAGSNAGSVQGIISNFQNLVLAVNALTASSDTDSASLVTAVNAGTTSSGTNTGVLSTAIAAVTAAITAQTTALGTQFGSSNVYTVATLPVVAVPARAFVSNSSVAASGNFGAVVAGGGTNIVPVYFDTVSWKIG